MLKILNVIVAQDELTSKHHSLLLDYAVNWHMHFPQTFPFIIVCGIHGLSTSDKYTVKFAVTDPDGKNFLEQTIDNFYFNKQNSDDRGARITLHADKFIFKKEGIYNVDVKIKNNSNPDEYASFQSFFYVINNAEKIQITRSDSHE